MYANCRIVRNSNFEIISSEIYGHILKEWVNFNTTMFKIRAAFRDRNLVADIYVEKYLASLTFVYIRCVNYAPNIIGR